MRSKFLVGLLLPVFLCAVTATGQQPAPPPEPDDEQFENTFSFFMQGGGFLGVYAENINRENMAHYRLSQVRGVGVTQVVKDSPAEKAGLRKDDVILRIDGENVTSVQKLNRIVTEMAPDHAVKITVSRAGAEQEVTATIGKRSNTNLVRDRLTGEPKIWKWDSNDPKLWKWEGPLINRDNLKNEGDLTIFVGGGRRIGVSTMALTEQLAEYFGVAGGRGVLVTAIIEGSPAAKAGVKAGDVITAVDGEAVESSGELSRVINRKKEGEVTLTITRNKSQQTIRVTPSESGGFSGTISPPEIGRHIVIPRIEFPSININLPRIRMFPRIKVLTTGQGPI